MKTHWGGADRPNPFATMTLEESGMSEPSLGYFTPWKDPVPAVREESRAARKTSSSLGFDPQTVHPVPSRYTD